MSEEQTINRNSKVSFTVAGLIALAGVLFGAFNWYGTFTAKQHERAMAVESLVDDLSDLENEIDGLENEISDLDMELEQERSRILDVQSAVRVDQQILKTIQSDVAEIKDWIKPSRIAE